MSDGDAVGDEIGMLVGEAVGMPVVGEPVGSAVGSAVGTAVGDGVGSVVDGPAVGWAVGSAVGGFDGVWDGGAVCSGHQSGTRSCGGQTSRLTDGHIRVSSGSQMPSQLFPEERVHPFHGRGPPYKWHRPDPPSKGAQTAGEGGKRPWNPS